MPLLLIAILGARAGIRTRVDRMKTCNDGPDYTTRATASGRGLGVKPNRLFTHLHHPLRGHPTKAMQDREEVHPKERQQ